MKTFVSVRLDTDVNVGGLSARARLRVHVCVQTGSADASLLVQQRDREDHTLLPSSSGRMCGK